MAKDAYNRGHEFLIGGYTVGGGDTFHAVIFGLRG
jgi:hypothetical protein